MPTNPPRSFYPALSIYLGAILWGIVWYPMRLLEAGGLVGIWLTLTIYATALIASLPVTYRAVLQWRLAPGWLLLLMLTAGWTNIAFVQAVLEGNILRVLLLFYLSPLWATLMGWLFLGERLSRAGIASLALAMAGALFMLWNPAIGAPWPQNHADWLGLSAGFAFAVSNIATRRVQNVSVATKVFCVWAGVTLMAIALLPVYAPSVPAVSLPIFAGALVLGLAILLMTLFVQYGVTYLPVYRSSVITFVELVAGAVSQQLLTDEVVSVREWIGGALIVIGAFLAVRAGVPEARTPKPP